MTFWKVIQGHEHFFINNSWQEHYRDSQIVSKRLSRQYNYFSIMSSQALLDKEDTIFSEWPFERSFKVTNTFLSITRDTNNIETRKWSQNVCLVNTHLLICSLTYLCHLDIDLGLDPGSNFWFDKFGMIWTAMTRETRLYQNKCSICFR